MNPLAPSVTDRLDQLHDQFNQAQPFRHLVIDQFFQTDYARQLQSEFPNFEERFALNEMGKLGGKAVRPDLPDLSETYAGLDAYIQSPEFLQTISRITGIPDLLYDPDYVGGGTHENVHGQGLSPHVDFNYLPKTQWHRRLNLIIYMNDEWKQEWGGCLDLHKNPWNHELDEVQTVLPLFNRCVIFETNEISWHGFERIELPESERHRSRRSIAIYLYTRERPAEETAPSHGTIYVPPGLPRGLQSGQTLAHEDYLELRRRFAQLKGQLKFLYERELETSRQIAEMSAAIDDARAAVGFPLQGKALREGPTRGYWPDGWAGPEVAIDYRLTAPARALHLDLWAPGSLADKQLISIELNGQRSSIEIPPGERARVELPLQLDAGQAIKLKLSCSQHFVPRDGGESSDARELSFRVVEASLV
ncbi:MAG: 2OG-Fe(II) oxygenase [Xanthomonadales bacterium]|nr:2OG-Fe(II) oxygenase [Xanthomonadales bacterium]